MTTFNAKTAKFGFDVGAFKVLMTTSTGKPVIYHSYEYKGRKYTSIRPIYFDATQDIWMPGKGLTLNPVDVAPFCAALGKLTVPVAAPKPASLPRKAAKAVSKTGAKRRAGGRG